SRQVRLKFRSKHCLAPEFLIALIKRRDVVVISLYRFERLRKLQRKLESNRPQKHPRHEYRLQSTRLMVREGEKRLFGGRRIIKHVLASLLSFVLQHCIIKGVSCL